MSTSNEPPENWNGEGDDDLEERPKLSLQAAIAWIGTRDPELIHQIDTDDWGRPLNEATFKFASNGSDAWTQLQSHLATGEITAEGIAYLIPDEFDILADGWSAKGGGFHRKISPELFSELEPVTHQRAPYSALRPRVMIRAGETWYRDIHVDLEDLQRNFLHEGFDKQKPDPLKRRREALKSDAATRVFDDLYSTPESRAGTNFQMRLDGLNEVLVSQGKLKVSASLLKDIEKAKRLKKP
jgi:hypothetical protein